MACSASKFSTGMMKVLAGSLGWSTRDKVAGKCSVATSRSNPVWVMPIFRHLANLDKGTSISNVAPAGLTLLPVCLGDDAGSGHPGEWWEPAMAGAPAGEPLVLPPGQGAPEERPAGEAGGGGVQTVPELRKNKRRKRFTNS